MKTAILQVADTGPVESLVEMLEAVGYTCFLSGDDLLGELRRLDCDTLISVKSLVESWGYEVPCNGRLLMASVEMMDQCDLYVDVKAHRNGPKIWKKWPRLEGRTLWYRINGGRPEHVIRADGFDCGDEANPPCPILTPNQWYKSETFTDTRDHDNVKPCPIRVPWYELAYTCWPPFVRFDDYLDQHHRPRRHYNLPVCLIHKLAGWGYSKLAESLKPLNIQFYGLGSPNGLIKHQHIPMVLSKTIAMVHLKSSDAPGYAIYEALAAGCPVVCSRRLIWRNRMEELLIPGKTCLVFDRETHNELSDRDAEQCTEEIRGHLERLQSPSYNQQIGKAGHDRLREVVWDKDNPRDRNGLVEFIGRHFSGT